MYTCKAPGLGFQGSLRDTRLNRRISGVGDQMYARIWLRLARFQTPAEIEPVMACRHSFLSIWGPCSSLDKYNSHRLLDFLDLRLQLLVATSLRRSLLLK